MKKNLWKSLLVGSVCALGFGFSNCEKVDATRLLIDNGTQLIEGIKNRRLTKKAVEELIDDGADLRLRDREGCTALMYAILNRDLEIVDLLIEKGSDVNARDNKGLTVLMYASKENDEFNDKGSIKLKIVQKLLEKGAKIKGEDNRDIKDENGTTALIYAAATESSESIDLDFKGKTIVQTLIENGADANYYDSDYSALEYACVNNCPRNILAVFKALEQDKVLYEKAIKVKERFKNKIEINPIISELLEKIDSAISIIRRYDFHGHDLKEFKPLCEELCEQDNGILDAFMGYAVRYRKLDIIKYLIEKGAKIDSMALIAAIQCENKEMVEYLITKEADVNVKDGHGQTALMFAVESGNLEIVKLLIKNGAKINVIDELGRMTLAHAAFSDIEIARYLITCGADLNLKNSKGDTVLDILRNLVNKMYIELHEVEVETEIRNFIIDKIEKLEKIMELLESEI